MSSDFLFSFDSPNSQRYTLGPVSFSINTVYIASMKLLFNQASLYPTIEDKENLTTALDIVDTLVATNKVPTYSESNECITYFINKFLVPESEFYSPENFQVLHTRLRDLISDVELWIQQNSEKLRKKDEAIANELQAMPSESQKLLEKIRAFISSGRDSLSPDEHEYFRKIDRIFKRANDTWLYQIILNDEVSDFFFLHYMNGSHLNSKFIIQCIEHENYTRANKLIDLLIKTSTFPDYAPKGGNMWEHSARLTIIRVLEEYYPSDSTWKEEHSIENREFAVTLAERLYPYLTVDSQKELLGPLTMADPQKRYQQQYIDTLLDDVVHYAQIKKPRGWGSARVVNRISDEIIHCFSILEKINRIDIILSVLRMLRAPGAALSPINYSRWLYEFCRESVSPETYDSIVRELK